MTEGVPARPDLVDWQLAKATGRRLVSAGPAVSRAEAAVVVESLRAAARDARDPIAETSRLESPADAPEALIVDRGGWIEANIDSMRPLMSSVIDKVVSSAEPSGHKSVAFIGGKVTAAEVGSLMAFLSSKILGQYDLAPDGTPRLLLVAPNLVHVERELKVDPHDFRRWVAMHEETHRVQFTAVPWMREHLIERTRSLTADLAPNPAELAARLQDVVRRLPEAVGSGSNGLTDAFLTPEQRERVASLTAVMSLLEGHADVMMDEVGPRVIPSVAVIRERFGRRRASPVGLDRLVRRLLGLEAKMRQYADGAAFVRGVVDRVGLDDFNAIWTSPDTLPSPAEIADPQAWVRRVHGTTGTAA